MQKKEHNLACFQKLKFLIFKLSFRYVGLPEKSSASDCRDLASCQFSHKVKEKLLNLGFFLSIYVHSKLSDLCLNFENKLVCLTLAFNLC